MLFPSQPFRRRKFGQLIKILQDFLCFFSLSLYLSPDCTLRLPYRLFCHEIQHRFDAAKVIQLHMQAGRSM